MSEQIVHVNTLNRPTENKYVTVIIRAYGNEPVRLKAVGFDERTVDVIGSDPDKSVSFPVEWVYRNNEETYEQLVSAYKLGNAERLLALWKTASSFDPKLGN